MFLIVIESPYFLFANNRFKNLKLTFQILSKVNCPEKSSIIDNETDNLISLKKKDIEIPLHSLDQELNTEPSKTIQKKKS